MRENFFTSTNVAAKHGYNCQSELMLLFKAIVTVEGMGRLLVDDFVSHSRILSNLLYDRARSAQRAGHGAHARAAANKRFAGDWTVRREWGTRSRAGGSRGRRGAGHRAARLTRAAQRQTLPKPAISAVVIDPILQTFPLAQGTSGRKNFTYIADFQNVGNEVDMFHRIVGFKHLAALVDDALMNAMPALQSKADDLAKALNARITIVRTRTDVAAGAGRHSAGRGCRLCHRPAQLPE